MVGPGAWMAPADGAVCDGISAGGSADDCCLLADVAAGPHSGAGQRVSLTGPGCSGHLAVRGTRPAGRGDHASRGRCSADGWLGRSLACWPAATDIGACQPARNSSGGLGDVPLPASTFRSTPGPPVLHYHGHLVRDRRAYLHSGLPASMERLSGSGMVAHAVSRPPVVYCSLADSSSWWCSIRCCLYGPLAAQMEKFVWNSTQAGNTDSHRLICGVCGDNRRTYRDGHVGQLRRA